LRRTAHRLEKIAQRLDVLGGYIVAYLNLDRVIEIIRGEDEPKPALMAEDWGGGVHLTDTQAEAILNMRLRSLRRLEEMELRAERDRLLAEQAELRALQGDDGRQWGRIADEIRDIRDRFGPPRALRGICLAGMIDDAKRDHQPYPPGARRTGLADAPQVSEMPVAAHVEREPVTIVCSAQGWIRALRGHQPLDAELKYKDGDAHRFVFHAETTDRLLAFATNGRFYTLAPDRLPGGRGTGEPLRLMIDLPNEAAIVALFVHRPGARLLVAATTGHGFVVPEDEVVAQTRAGKQVLNVGGGGDAAARVCRPAAGDHVAAVGENRKLLVFPLAELPEMARGKGVRLQTFKDGGLSDAIVFELAGGLGWTMGGSGGRRRTMTEAELRQGYLLRRAAAGRMAPQGFPRDLRFG
jgi:topoisomerase-4 subunit A